MQAHYVISGLLYFLFVLLVISVVWLISRLKKKSNQVYKSDVNKSLFDKEIKILWVILSVFSFTYLIRAVWDTMTSELYKSYALMVSAMSLTLLWDFAPVMLLLIFHYRNYREQALLQNE